MLEQLCHINDVSDPGAKGFKLKQGRKERLLFIVKKGGQVFAYENKCPHAGLNLEWKDDDFLDTEKNHIQCSVHGALFTIEDGNCIGGPCNGDSLTSADIEVDKDGHIHLLA